MSSDTEAFGDVQTGALLKDVPLQCRWRLKLSTEWHSLTLAGTELYTVGPATGNARRANLN